MTCTQQHSLQPSSMHFSSLCLLDAKPSLNFPDALLIEPLSLFYWPLPFFYSNEKKIMALAKIGKADFI